MLDQLLQSKDVSEAQIEHFATVLGFSFTPNVNGQYSVRFPGDQDSAMETDQQEKTGLSERELEVGRLFYREVHKAESKRREQQVCMREIYQQALNQLSEPSALPDLMDVDGTSSPIDHPLFGCFNQHDDSHQPSPSQDVPSSHQRGSFGVHSFSQPPTGQFADSLTARDEQMRTYFER